MATINSVSPWEGELVWKGEVRSGKTISGAEWKNMEFTLRYEDQQMNEKFITFSLFGAAKVSSVEKYPIGSWLKVVWWPESSQGKDGKYYPKNSVIAVYPADAPAKSADTKITAPTFQQQGTQLPGNAGYAQVPSPQPPLPTYNVPVDVPQDDLPF